MFIHNVSNDHNTNFLNKLLEKLFDTYFTDFYFNPPIESLNNRIFSKLLALGHRLDVKEHTNFFTNVVSCPSFIIKDKNLQ